MGNGNQWVLIKRFAEITGYSENAVRHKVKNGTWMEGRIWRKAPDGRIFVNVVEFDPSPSDHQNRDAPRKR